MKAQQWSFTGLFVIVSGLVLLMYRASKRDATGDRLAMEAIAAELRLRRVAAKKQLLAAATESGEIPLGNGKSIKWWSSGPSDADVYVVLAAEDRETAAVWGGVHARLAQSFLQARSAATTAAGAGTDVSANDVEGHHIILPTESVRIISFHRVDPAAPPPTSNALHNRPVSLRAGDVDTLVSHLCKHRNSAVSSASVSSLRSSSVTSNSTLSASLYQSILNVFGWLWGSVPAPTSASPSSSSAMHRGDGHETPRVLVVHQGQGAWAGLAYTSIHHDTCLGAVCVAPLYMNRGRQMAWVDAIVAASRMKRESDPKVLEHLLDPPPVDVSDDFKVRLDALIPRRAEILKFYSSLGFGNNQAAIDGRFAEDFRRMRSSQPVISELETRMLESRGDDTLGSTGTLISGHQQQQLWTQHPIIRAITYAPDALPSFIGSESRAVVESFFLLSANRIGQLASDPSSRRMIDEAWAAVQPAVSAELKGEEVPQHTKDKIAASSLPLLSSSRIGSGAAEPAGSGALSSSVADTASDAMSAAIKAAAATASSALPTFVPENYEQAHIFHGVKRIPAALGLASGGDVKFEDTFTYRHLEGQLRAMPAWFGVTLVHNYSSNNQKQPQTTKQDRNHQAPAEASAVASSSPAIGPATKGLVSLPLQRPDIVADVIVSTLLQAVRGGDGSRGAQQRQYMHAGLQ